MTTAEVSVVLINNTLNLRFYKKGEERKYKAITKYLIGKFKVSHWDDDKKRIKPSTPYSTENNIIISKELNKYNDIIASNKDISAKELCCYFDENKSRSLVSLEKLVLDVIEKEKQKTGCNYKNYEKLHRRLLEYRTDLKEINISKVDETFCAKFSDWIINVHKTNYAKTTKCFMALLRRISEDKGIDWNIENINGYNFKKNAPPNNKVDKLPDFLNKNEIKSFYDYDPVASKGKRDSKRVEIYHDYCIFMFETYMRPVDVLLLKYDKIKIINNTKYLQYIPKKKENLKSGNNTVHVPLSDRALRLIEKYKDQTLDNYIFPIASEERIKGYKDGVEGFSKRINLQINEWLKVVGKDLNLNFDKGLYLYVFRHTAISVALNVYKMPASTIARIAGTSIASIEKHYNSHLITDIPTGILEAFGHKEAI